MLAKRKKAASKRAKCRSGTIWIMLILLIAGIPVLATAKTVELHTSLMSFLGSYTKNASKYHYPLPSSFTFPAAWLYSPTGKLVSIGSDPQSIDGWAHPFPPKSAHAIAGQPSLQAISSILYGASGQRVSRNVQVNQWSIILFLSNSPSCKYCAPVREAVMNLQREHAAALRVVSVTVDEGA